MVFLIIKAECSNKIDCKRTYQVKQWCLCGNENIWQAAEFVWKMVLLRSNLIRKNVVVNSSKMEKMLRRYNYFHLGGAQEKKTKDKECVVHLFTPISDLNANVCLHFLFTFSYDHIYHYI